MNAEIKKCTCGGFDESLGMLRSFSCDECGGARNLPRADGSMTVRPPCSHQVNERYELLELLMHIATSNPIVFNCVDQLKMSRYSTAEVAASCIEALARHNAILMDCLMKKAALETPPIVIQADPLTVEDIKNTIGFKVSEDRTSVGRFLTLPDTWKIEQFTPTPPVWDFAAWRFRAEGLLGVEHGMFSIDELEQMLAAKELSEARPTMQKERQHEFVRPLGQGVQGARCKKCGEVYAGSIISENETNCTCKSLLNGHEAGCPMHKE